MSVNLRRTDIGMITTVIQPKLHKYHVLIIIKVRIIGDERGLAFV